jgi:hypothetical protein
MPAQRGTYDGLSAPQQALTRAVWDREFTARIRVLNFEAEFIENRDSWVEADAEGRTIRYGLDGQPEPPRPGS